MKLTQSGTYHRLFCVRIMRWSLIVHLNASRTLSFQISTFMWNCFLIRRILLLSYVECILWHDESNSDNTENHQSMTCTCLVQHLTFTISTSQRTEGEHLECGCASRFKWLKTLMTCHQHEQTIAWHPTCDVSKCFHATLFMSRDSFEVSTSLCLNLRTAFYTLRVP